MATKNNNETKNVQNAQVTNQYNVITYTTKKGGTAALVMGFNTEADAKAISDKACKTVGSTWRYNDKGEKVYALSFGSRYCDIAIQLCDALNKGDKEAADKAIAQTHDVYNAVVSAGKAEREAKKEERKASKKSYTKEEVTALLKGVINGDKDAMAIVNEMMGKAA